MCPLLPVVISRQRPTWSELQKMRLPEGILYHPLPAPSNDEGVCFESTPVQKYIIYTTKKQKADLSGIRAKATVGLIE